jgi:putative endonuclease
MPYMYILECADRSLYVGSTTDLHARVAAHQSGRAAAYTSRPGRRPVTLVYAVELPDVATAFHWEKRVQGWSRKKRWALISGRVDLLKDASRRRGGRPLG